MKFTTIVQVPNTKNAVFYDNLVREENRLAKLSGYNANFVECLGILLVRLFPTVFKHPKCHRHSCQVCKESDKKFSNCKSRNLVYEGICKECEDEAREGNDDTEVGVYIGESSRTLAERATEHVKGAL